MVSKEDATGRVRAARSQLRIDGYGAATIIGRGDAGVVYRARQRALQRTVAVKVFDGAVFDDAAVRQIERLSGHPNIVAVYDSGLTETGEPYVAMEYLARGSLADELRRMGPVDWRQVVTWGVRLAGALEFAHRLGVVHGDIKPENVLLSNYGEPELSDFGNAETSEASDTAALASMLQAVTDAVPEPVQDVFDKAAGEGYLSAMTLGRALQAVEADRGLARTEMTLEADIPAPRMRTPITAPVPDLPPPPPPAPPAPPRPPASHRELLPERPPRSRRRVFGIVGLVVLLVVVAVVVATRHQSSSQKASTSNSTALPGGAADLVPGAYRSDAFDPGVAFRVDSGWHLAAADTANQLQLTRTDTPSAALGFHMIDDIIDPASAPARGQDVDPTVRALPSDAAGWLRDNSRLHITATGPSTIGGRGTFVDFSVANGYTFDNGTQSNPCAKGSCVMLFRTVEKPPTLVGAVRGDTLRFYLVPKATRLLVISVSAPAAEYASFSQAAQNVLATLTVNSQ